MDVSLIGTIVDTCVWSRALRKSSQKPDPKFLKLLSHGDILMLGPIRQEILSGIKSQVQFRKLTEHLAPFQDIPIVTEDYVCAADFFNQCRRKGIQGSFIDFIICAVAYNRNCSIYTYDNDFNRYQKALRMSVLP